MTAYTVFIVTYTVPNADKRSPQRGIHSLWYASNDKKHLVVIIYVISKAITWICENIGCQPRHGAELDTPTHIQKYSYILDKNQHEFSAYNI